MARPPHAFSRYTFIGVANTLIHWQLFFILHAAVGLRQAYSNVLAFCAAASFSFFVNARFTFAATPSFRRYGVFMACLGGLSVLTGWLADRWQLPALLTLVVFSLISLCGGYVLSRWLVFGHVTP